MVCAFILGGLFAQPAAATEPFTWPPLDEPPAGLRRSAGKNDAALIVAIEDYTYLPDIPGADDNAYAWESWLLARGVHAPSIEVFVDRKGAGSGSPAATKEQVRRAAQRAAASVGSGGTLWVVFIGHGAPSGGGDVYLLGTDVARSADSFRARGISRAELLAEVQSAPGTAVVVLDTCFSGQSVGGGSLVDEALMPALATSLAAQRGVIELLATSRDEFAGPLPGADRPAFSYLVLGALRGWGEEARGAERDGKVTAQEAVSYAKETLRMLVRGRSQVPVSNVEPVSLLGVPLAEGTETGPDRVEARRALYGAADEEVPADAGLREKLWHQACDAAAEELAIEGQDAELADAAQVELAALSGAWSTLEADLAACLEIPVSDRSPCVDEVNAWIGQARSVSVSVPMSSKTVRPRLGDAQLGSADCGEREVVVQAAASSVTAPELPAAEAWLDRLLGKARGGSDDGGPRWAPRSRRTVGLITASVGVASMAGTQLAAPHSPSDGSSLLGVNAAGLLVAGAGTALVVASLGDTKPKPRRYVGSALLATGLAAAVATEVAPRTQGWMTDVNGAGWALATVGGAVLTTSFFDRRRKGEREPR